MITIPIQVVGDIWNNRKEVEDILKTLMPGTSIMLDVCSEGPSLDYIGVLGLLAQYDLNVTITRWSNNVENVPFKRYFCNAHSHFYPMASHYWGNEVTNDPCAEFKFGLFLGRSTTARDAILYNTFQTWSGKFLLSKMPDLYNTKWKLNPNDDSGEEWFTDAAQVEHWFNSQPVPSIQGYAMQDQYKIPEVSTGNMMRELINDYYPTFNIELVCETYTRGKTFFPTEKTVRSIVGNKPFIVYGPVGYLTNLRQTEGFKTFSELWNESYDQYEGPTRWKAISDLVDSLLLLNSDQWEELVQRASTITQYNRNILKKIIDDRKKL